MRLPQGIRRQIAGDLIEIFPEDWQAAHQIVSGLPGVLETQTYGEALHLLVEDGKKLLPTIEEALNNEGITLNGARLAPKRMEEAFISLIRRIESEAEESD